MSITHTATQKITGARERINQQVEEFLAAGGSITEIPRGQSAHNLEIRTVENKGHGTRRHYVDPKLQLSSAEGKAASIRQRKTQKENERLRKAKERGDEMRAQGKARRAQHMPKIRQMLDEGKSRREIAKVIGVAHGTVNYWLKLEGLTSGR